jgi:hypothetical protein
MRIRIQIHNTEKSKGTVSRDRNEVWHLDDEKGQCKENLRMILYGIHDKSVPKLITKICQNKQGWKDGAKWRTAKINYTKITQLYKIKFKTILTLFHLSGVDEVGIARSVRQVHVGS